MRAILVILSALIPCAAVAQGPDDGRLMAERWCMGCHLVERQPGRSAGETIPSFSEIARTSGMTRQRLESFLSTGHTHMPDFRLSAQERDALISYILSQK